MEACSKPPGPGYVLYKEIYMNSEAAEQLAHVANIPLSRNIFDSIFNSLGPDSIRLNPTRNPTIFPTTLLKL